MIMTISMANKFTIPSVHAQSVSNLPYQKIHTQPNRLLTSKDSTSYPGKLSSLNNQLNQSNLAIQNDKKKLKEADLEIATAQTEVNQLKDEMKLLADSIEKRNHILKERTLAYQQNRGNSSFLDVLLSATSFTDLINRIGAVAMIVEADQNLWRQQESETKDYEDKKSSLEKKLTLLAGMNADYKGIQGQLLEQQKQSERLQVQLTKEKEDLANIDETQKEIKHLAYIGETQKEKGYVNTVITVGNKFIGNSVYVFGGGRNPYDINKGRFDCSGFVHWAFAQAGIEVGFNTDAIKGAGKQVSVSEMQPGDLVFFDTYKIDGHVGIYLGNGKFIGSQSSTGVGIADMSKGYWQKAFSGRVIRI
jgi:cell wall-associated NlpC family hydrolase